MEVEIVTEVSKLFASSLYLAQKVPVFVSMTIKEIQTAVVHPPTNSQVTTETVARFHDSNMKCFRTNAVKLNIFRLRYPCTVKTPESRQLTQLVFLGCLHGILPRPCGLHSDTNVFNLRREVKFPHSEDSVKDPRATMTWWLAFLRFCKVCTPLAATS